MCCGVTLNSGRGVVSLKLSFVFQVELKEFIKVENEIYEVKNDRIGRNEEIPLKRSRRVKHKVPTYSIIKTSVIKKQMYRDKYKQNFDVLNEELSSQTTRQEVLLKTLKFCLFL